MARCLRMAPSQCGALAQRQPAQRLTTCQQTTTTLVMLAGMRRPASLHRRHPACCACKAPPPAAEMPGERRAAAALSAHARTRPRSALLAAQCEASNAPARLPQKRGRQPWRHRVAWLLQRRPPPPASKPPAAATRGRTSDPRPLPHRSIVQPILGLERRPRRTLLCGAASAALAWRRSSAPHNPVAAGHRRAAARMQPLPDAPVLRSACRPRPHMPPTSAPPRRAPHAAARELPRQRCAAAPAARTRGGTGPTRGWG